MIATNAVAGGLDLGSRNGASHLALVRRGEDGVLWQVSSEWRDEMPLGRVIEQAMELANYHGTTRLFYDENRGELQTLNQRDELPDSWEGQPLDLQTKQRIAGQLSLALERGELRLLPDERQQRQLTLVDSFLKTPDDEDEAGVFWSLALAVDAACGRKRGESYADFVAAALGWNQDSSSTSSHSEESSTDRTKRQILRQSALWRIGR